MWNCESEVDQHLRKLHPTAFLLASPHSTRCTFKLSIEYTFTEYIYVCVSISYAILHMAKLYIKPKNRNTVCAFCIQFLYPSNDAFRSICQIVVVSSGHESGSLSSPTAWLSGTPEVLQDARSMAPFSCRYVDGLCGWGPMAVFHSVAGSCKPVNQPVFFFWGGGGLLCEKNG